MTMWATVLEVRNSSLLVLDRSTCQQVIVFAQNTRCFCVGDCVRIEYNGIMTLSIPPQITADCICRVCC